MKPKKRQKKTWIEEAKELQEQILADRGGVLVPDSTPFIRACREGICVECGRDIVEVTEQAEKRKMEVNQMVENRTPRKVRVSRLSRVPKKTWREEAQEVRKRILEARGGVPVPSTAEVIREIREGNER